MDLIWAAGEALVIGPQTRSVKRPLPPQVAVVGARFAPGVGPSLLGVPAHELANMHVPLEAIDARPAGYLLRDLAAVESDATAASLIGHAIAKRVDSGRSRDVAVQRATALLADPGMRVARVAHALGLSERQLQRRFRDAVGYGPKTLQRVLRFQRLLTALRLGRNQPGGLAFIAAAVGYSDQAHLTREAREFSDLSPSRLGLALDALAEAGAPGVFKTGRPPRRDINARRTKPRAVQPPNGRARRPGSRRLFGEVAVVGERSPATRGQDSRHSPNIRDRSLGRRGFTGFPYC